MINEIASAEGIRVFKGRLICLNFQQLHKTKVLVLEEEEEETGGGGEEGKGEEENETPFTWNAVKCVCWLQVIWLKSDPPTSPVYHEWTPHWISYPPIKSQNSPPPKKKRRKKKQKKKQKKQNKKKQTKNSPDNSEMFSYDSCELAFIYKISTKFDKCTA